MEEACGTTHEGTIYKETSNPRKETNIMKTDYEDLEGKEITRNYNGSKALIKVAGCHYHIGITLVYANDTTRETMCLNRKDFTHQKGIYRALFHSAVRMIQNGTYYPEKTNKLRSLIDSRYRLNNNYVMATCAFK